MENMEKTLWLIWSIEHNAWWAPAWNGYVKNRLDAGKYKYTDAANIVASANIGEHNVPNEAMILCLD